MNIKACKSCGAPIVFLRSKSGKPMPINAATVKEGDKIYRAPDHVAHFATCDNPARFRKRAAK